MLGVSLINGGQSRSPLRAGDEERGRIRRLAPHGGSGHAGLAHRSERGAARGPWPRPRCALNATRPTPCASCTPGAASPAAERQLLGAKTVAWAPRCMCACAAPWLQCRLRAKPWAAPFWTTPPPAPDWSACRDHTLPWFAQRAQQPELALWRLSLPATAPVLALPAGRPAAGGMAWCPALGSRPRQCGRCPAAPLPRRWAVVLLFCSCQRLSRKR